MKIKKNKNFKILLFSFIFSLFNISCRSYEHEDTIYSGESLLNFNILSPVFSDTPSLATVGSSEKNKIESLGNETQIKKIIISPNLFLVAKLSPAENSVGPINKFSGLASNTEVSNSGYNLSSGTKIRVIVYNHKDGTYKVHQDYTVGETLKPVKLDGGVNYDVVIYSFGSNWLPTITAEEKKNISIAMVKYNDKYRDFMYQKQSITPDKNSSTLDIVLHHKNSLITTIIDGSGLGSTGTIASVSNAQLSPHSTNEDLFSLSTGMMDRVSSVATTSLVKFNGPYPASKQVSEPVIINADTKGVSSGSFSADITVEGIKKSIIVPNAFAIAPERRLNLAINLLNSTTSKFNPWKDNPYKVNIIYFVPNDLDTIPDYQKRISNVLLQMQRFFGDNLQRAGFGYTSFGLDLLSDSRVNIITIRGANGKISYPKQGGGVLIQEEIKQYFAQNPTIQKKGDHSLVILPAFNSDPDKPEGDQPFVGFTKSCFAMDYPGMDIDKLGVSGNIGNLASKYIGGLAHELGHGLNAPHNKEHKTDKSTLGTALMGAGNYTYGKSPTYITNATAALFSTSQPFVTSIRGDWYTPVQNKLVMLKGEFRDNKIIISGKYTSNVPVKVINVYHDGLPAKVNEDYDALAWNTSPASDNSFSVECPLDDFYNLSGQYELRIIFCHENGTLVTYKYQYEFANGVPNISVINKG